MAIVPHNTYRRALHLLYGSPEHGCTTNVLGLHGINDDVVTEMVGAGLISVELESLGSAEVERVRITQKGRQALAN